MSANSNEAKTIADQTVNPSYEPDAKGFVGVAPEYANYANETDAPLEASELESEDDEDESKSAPAKKAAPSKPSGSASGSSS